MIQLCNTPLDSITKMVLNLNECIKLMKEWIIAEAYSGSC